MSSLGTLIILSLVFLQDNTFPIKERILPFILYIIGTVIDMLGCLIKENHFRKYEMSEKRFFGIDSLWEFALLSVVIYPIISIIKCSEFNLFFKDLCTNQYLSLIHI